MNINAQEEPERRRRFAIAWRDVPAWLVSAVVHGVIVLILGLLTVEASGESKKTMLMSQSVVEELEELEDVLLEDPLEDIPAAEFESLSTQLEDPGLADFGTLAFTEQSDVEDMSELSPPEPLEEVGALFGSTGEGYASVGEGMGGATFFGVKAGGRRFVFVVDGSKSMNKNGWDQCKLELVSAMRRLRPYQHFYVILFAAVPHRQLGDEAPEPKLLRATDENIKKVQEWLYSFELELGTRPLESMKIALKLDPDGIYFLTDGKLHDDTEGYLKKQNKREDAYEDIVPGSVVHTIGFFTADGQEVLKRIADENGGSYRFVPRPPGARPPKRNRPGVPRPGVPRPGVPVPGRRP